jgi:hypothetical protein
MLDENDADYFSPNQPFVKQRIFTTAFDKLNELEAADEFLGATILAYSILEDRLCAAIVVASEAQGLAQPKKGLIDVPLAKRIKKLRALGALDDIAYGELISLVNTRNKLTHRMMWKFDCFHLEHVNEVKKQINKAKSIIRKYQRIAKATSETAL